LCGTRECIGGGAGVPRLVLVGADCHFLPRDVVPSGGVGGGVLVGVHPSDAVSAVELDRLCRDVALVRFEVSCPFIVKFVLMRLIHVDSDLLF